MNGLRLSGVLHFGPGTSSSMTKAFKMTKAEYSKTYKNKLQMIEPKTTEMRRNAQRLPTSKADPMK